MSLRKVAVSGTKGVGSGTRPAEMCLCSRRQGAQMYVGEEERREKSVRDFLVIMVVECSVQEVVCRMFELGHWRSRATIIV